MSFPFAGAELGPDIASMIYEGMIKPRFSKSIPHAVGTNAKIQKLQRRVAAMTPEVKTKQFTWTTAVATGSIVQLQLFNIPEGTGEDERIGDRIRIKSISIRGNPNFGLDDVDFYIVKLNDVSAIPLPGNFLNVPGGHLASDIGREIFHKQFQVGSLDQTLSYKKYFKSPLVVKYTNVGTTPDQNNWFLVVKNLSGSSFNTKFSVEIKYTD